jgi:hypothetical protein
MATACIIIDMLASYALGRLLAMRVIYGYLTRDTRYEIISFR